jgi:hypothetical protein
MFGTWKSACQANIVVIRVIFLFYGHDFLEGGIKIYIEVKISRISTIFSLRSTKKFLHIYNFIDGGIWPFYSNQFLAQIRKYGLSDR